MASSVYDIAIRMQLHTGGMAGTASMAIALFENLRGQARAAGAATDALNASMAATAGGIALTAAGVAGARVLGGWIDNAGKLQTAMANVGMATQGTVAQLAALQTMTFDVSAKTRFAAVSVAQFEAQAASLGLNNRQVLLSIVPTLANVAEVDQALRNIAPKQSIAASVAIAQTFGQVPSVDRNGQVNQKQLAQFKQLLDLSSRAELVSGLSPNQLARSVSRMAPYAATLGMTPTDIISSISLAARVGLISGAGGASRLAAIFRTITPTLNPSLRNKARDQVELIGGGQFYKNGSFQAAGGFTNALNIAERFMTSPQARKNEERALQLLNQAFLTTGSQAFSVLATPSSIKAYQSIRNALGPNGLPSTSANQQTLYETFQGQSITLRSNLTDITTLLGAQLLPAVLPVLRGFVNLTNAVRTFLEHHAGVAQFVATFAAVSVAAALIAGPVLVAVGAFGILSAAGLTLSLSFFPFTALVLGIVAAIAGVTWAITHWSTVLGFLNDPLGALSGKFGLIGQGIMLAFGPLIGLINGFRLLWGWGVRLLDWAGGFSGIATAVGGAFGVMGAYFSPLVQMVSALLDLGGHLVDWAGKLPGVAGVISGALQVAFAPLRLAIEALKVLHGFWDWLTGNHNTGHASATTSAVVAARALAPVIAAAPRRYTPAHGWETDRGGMWQYQQSVPGKGLTWMTDGRAPVVAARGDTHYHITVHPGAAHVEVHPAPHQDAHAIAHEAAALAATEIARQTAHALSHGALSVTTAYPSLHGGTMGPA